MLVLSRKKGERICIGERILVTVLDLHRSQVRLGIDAPKDVDVFREELTSQWENPVEESGSLRSIQVCYCFDWTTGDIERELRLTGTTTIPDRIKEKVQQGLCHCETMNPQGSCCFGNVRRALREIKRALTGPTL